MIVQSAAAVLDTDTLTLTVVTSTKNPILMPRCTVPLRSVSADDESDPLCDQRERNPREHDGATSEKIAQARNRQSLEAAAQPKPHEAAAEMKGTKNNMNDTTVSKESFSQGRGRSSA